MMTIMEKEIWFHEEDNTHLWSVLSQKWSSYVNYVKTMFEDVLELHKKSTVIAKMTSGLLISWILSWTVHAWYEMNGYYIWDIWWKTYSISSKGIKTAQRTKINRGIALWSLRNANFPINNHWIVPLIDWESKFTSDAVWVNKKNKYESRRIDACFMQINSQEYPNLINMWVLKSYKLLIHKKGTSKWVSTINVDDIFNVSTCAKAAKYVLGLHWWNPCTAWFWLKGHCSENKKLKNMPTTKSKPVKLDNNDLLNAAKALKLL